MSTDSTTDETVSTSSALWLAVTAPLLVFSKQEEEAAQQDIDNLLAGLVGEGRDDEAAETLANAEYASDEDVMDLFEAQPKALVRKALKDMRIAGTPKVKIAEPSFGVSFLPTPPDTASFLKGLSMGDTFKFEPVDAIAAVHVLFGQRYTNLDGVEKRVLTMILDRSRQLRELAPPVYKELLKSSRRKEHRSILNALGFNSEDVFTLDSQNYLLTQLGGFFPRMQQAHHALDVWIKQLERKQSNMGVIGMSLANALHGNAGSSVIDAPNPGAVLDAAGTFRGALNGMFAGTGIPVVRGLAADSLATREFLNDTRLLGALGVGSKEELLTALKIDVNRSLIRAETATIQYLLGLLEIEDTEPHRLSGYLQELYQVGEAIPWELLLGNTPASGGLAPHQVRSQSGPSSPIDRHRGG